MQNIDLLNNILLFISDPNIYLSACHLFLSTCLTLTIHLSIFIPVHYFTYVIVHQLQFLIFNLPFYLSTCLLEIPADLYTCYLSIYIITNLSICPLFFFTFYLFTCLPVYLSICLHVYLNNCRSAYPSTCLPVHLSTCITANLSTDFNFYLSICQLVYLLISLPFLLFT